MNGLDSINTITDFNTPGGLQSLREAFQLMNTNLELVEKVKAVFARVDFGEFVESNPEQGKQLLEKIIKIFDEVDFEKFMKSHMEDGVQIFNAMMGPNMKFVLPDVKTEPSPFQKLIGRVINTADVIGEKNKSYLDKLMEVREYLTHDSSSINEYDQNFQATALHKAAGAGLQTLVELLLEFNPDTTIVNCFDQTAAQRARDFAGREDIALIIDNHTK